MKLPPGGRAVITFHIEGAGFKPVSTMVRLEESDLQRAEVVLTGWIPQVLSEVDGKFIDVAGSWQVVADNGVEVVWKRPDRPNPRDGG